MTEEREDEAREHRGELEERLRQMLLGRRQGPLSEDTVRALVRMVEEIVRICQEVLAVAIAGLPFPADEEIADMEAGRAPASKAAFQIAEIWRASLALEDAEGHLAELAGRRWRGRTCPSSSAPPAWRSRPAARPTAGLPPSCSAS